MALSKLEGDADLQYTKLWAYAEELRKTNPGSSIILGTTDDNRCMITRRRGGPLKPLNLEIEATARRNRGRNRREQLRRREEMAEDNLVDPEVDRVLRGNENEEIERGVQERGRNEVQNAQAAVQFPPGFDPGAKLPTHEGKATNEDALALILKKMEENGKMVAQQYKGLETQFTQMSQQVTQLSQQQRNTDFQLGQLATTVGNMQNKGKFPSTTEPNPKEHCKAIELRSGTKYQGPQLPSEDDVEENTAEVEQEKEKDEVEEVEEDEEIESNQEDEEEKGLMKKKGKEVESSHRVPKWKVARSLKEKASDDIECDEWGIPKVPDRIPFPRRFVKNKLDRELVIFDILRRMMKGKQMDSVLRSWQLTGIPCPHGICAILRQGLDPVAFVDECYSVRKYVKAYELPIYGISHDQLWGDTLYIPPLPPNFGTMGKITKKRRLEKDEKNPKGKGKKVRMRRQQTTIKCNKCKQEGHNVATCKEVIPETEGPGEGSGRVNPNEQNRVHRNIRRRTRSSYLVDEISDHEAVEEVVVATCKEVIPETEGPGEGSGRVNPNEQNRVHRNIRRRTRSSYLVDEISDHEAVEEVVVAPPRIRNQMANEDPVDEQHNDTQQSTTTNVTWNQLSP
ncbi:hypothetical protein ACS0TY_014933 [Phlomoides rotata]